MASAPAELVDGRNHSVRRPTLGALELVCLLAPMSFQASMFLALSWAKAPEERRRLVKVVSNGLRIATSDYVAPTTSFRLKNWCG